MSDIKPLYSSLSNAHVSTVKDLTPKQKQLLIDRIASMNIDSIEIIYALIRHHSIINSEKTMYEVSIVTGDDHKSKMTWDFKKMDKKLKHILFDFSKRDDDHQQEKNEKTA